MPLIVVDPDDLKQVLAWLCFGAAGLGFVGAMAFAVVAGLARCVGRAIRMRSLREPFAVRARRVEDLRVRTFVAMDRICQRNAREAARRG